MKKFIAGFILGVIVTLYFFNDLGTNPLQPYLRRKENITIINNSSKNAAHIDDNNKNNKKSFPQLMIIKQQDNLPFYQMKLSGPQSTETGNILISENKTVWCNLSTLSKCMGWNIKKDGPIYSAFNKNPSKIFKVINNIDKNKDVSNVYVCLSDLKKLWILDFSIDPSSHTLIIK